MTDICLGFEVHQPFRLRKNFFWDRLEFRRASNRDLANLYFDQALNREIFDRAAKKCYFPSNEILFQQIDAHRAETRKAKFTLSISGIFLEQCEMWNPDLLDSFRQLAETGCVDFLAQSYYHSLASLWEDKEEWLEQIKLQRRAMKDLLAVEPRFFENTEFLFNNSIARTVEKLGYEGIFTEGVDRVLGWRSPNYVYKAAGCDRLRVLLRNHRLTDDFGFRFSARWWPEWPLTADKFSRWLAATPGECIVLFADYETFGEHHWPESGIRDFLRHLPGEILKYDHLWMSTPNDILKRNQPVGEIDVDDFSTISWADIERDTSCWLGNTMQWAYYQGIKSLAPLISEARNPDLKRVWRYLQGSDHLYYMFTAGGGPGEVHSYFSPYGTPYDAFVTGISVYEDLRARLVEMTYGAASPFNFYDEENHYTGISAHSLIGFLEALRKVDVKSIRFHLRRGDLRRWVDEALQDPELARKLARSRLEKLSDSRLRETLRSTVTDRVQNILRFRWLEHARARSRVGEKALTPTDAARMLRRLPSWRAFWFYRDMDEPLGQGAMSLSEFSQLISAIEEQSLEFHVQRKDFESWIREGVGDKELADRIRDLGRQALPGDQLRKRLCSMVEQRYHELGRIASEGSA
jgi:alpha-amylase